jgi:hypothetical protein
MPPSRADVEAARADFHIRRMKNLITAPLALALLAFSLSGCVWYPDHGWHDHGGYYGHGGYGYDHGGYYGH